MVGFCHKVVNLAQTLIFSRVLEIFNISVPASRFSHTHKVLDIISPLCRRCGSPPKGSSPYCWAAPPVKRWAFRPEQCWWWHYLGPWGCGRAWSGWKCGAPTAAPSFPQAACSAPESGHGVTLPLCHCALVYQKTQRHEPSDHLGCFLSSNEEISCKDIYICFKVLFI